MKITIDFIPHLEQRYNTCGDWVLDQNGDLNIHVSRMSSTKREQLVAVHELVEALLCLNDGITQEEVDAFDISYRDLAGEQGDAPNAPYREQHCLATGVERVLAAVMHEQWLDYENELIDMTAVYEGHHSGEEQSE